MLLSELFFFATAQIKPAQVLIYDSQGKKVYEQLHLPKNQEIDVQLPQHPPGLYIVQLSSGLLITQLRILKKN